MADSMEPENVVGMELTALLGLQPLSFDFSEWRSWSGRLAIMQHSPSSLHDLEALNVDRGLILV